MCSDRGTHPRPGEISLAHHGVLFLDELPEFDRRVLEVLREPMESGRIAIARVAGQAEFPARFQLIAAMNPCPCGYYGAQSQRCRCTPAQISRYQRKISGPLLDRIDLHVEVAAMSPTELRGAQSGECSDAVRDRVVEAQNIAQRRQRSTNAALAGKGLHRAAPLGEREVVLLERACERLGLSARAYHRVQRIARTIADLAGDEKISVRHLMEAIQYRRLDALSGHRAA